MDLPATIVQRGWGGSRGLYRTSSPDLAAAGPPPSLPPLLGARGLDQGGGCSCASGFDRASERRDRSGESVSLPLSQRSREPKGWPQFPSAPRWGEIRQKSAGKWRNPTACSGICHRTKIQATCRRLGLPEERADGSAPALSEDEIYLSPRVSRPGGIPADSCALLLRLRRASPLALQRSPSSLSPSSFRQEPFRIQASA